MPTRHVRLPFVFCAAWLLAAVCLPADRLILRNLDILTSQTVASFDEDGLVLDRPRPGGSQRITWDEVARGKVALDQPRFDRLLSELGPPLYQIRQRLKIGDYEAAGEPAEALYPRFAERKSQTAYLVCQATMWSRLAAGKREAAVEPFVRSCELLHSKVASGDPLPGSRRLIIDAATAMSPELPPVWFDPAAAKAALPGVEQAIRAMTQPRPAGPYIYYASLAIAAGEMNEVERIMPALAGEEATIKDWRDIVEAERELASDSPGAAIERLKMRSEILSEPCRPVALYVVGRAGAQSADDAAVRDGVLSLLMLPAVYGADQAELAAAGLYHAAAALDKLKDVTGAAALRRELAGHYPNTHFWAKARDAAAR